MPLQWSPRAPPGARCGVRAPPGGRVGEGLAEAESRPWAGGKEGKGVCGAPLRGLQDRESSVNAFADPQAVARLPFGARR